MTYNVTVTSTEINMQGRQQNDKFMIRLPDGVRDRLKEAAQRNRRSMNAELGLALEAWLDSRATKNPATKPVSSPA